MIYKIDFDGENYVLRTNDGSLFNGNLASVSFQNYDDAFEYLVSIDPEAQVDVKGHFVLMPPKLMRENHSKTSKGQKHEIQN